MPNSILVINMTNPWDNLPNAKHIDFVLEHVKLHHTTWEAARNAAGEVAWFTAYRAARNAVWYAVREAACVSAWDAAKAATRDAAKAATRDALISLIAYDDCAHLLYSDPNEVEVLAKLGVPAAVLILPACIAISGTKEENVKSLG